MTVKYYRRVRTLWLVINKTKKLNNSQIDKAINYQMILILKISRVFRLRKNSCKLNKTSKKTKQNFHYKVMKDKDIIQYMLIQDMTRINKNLIM